MKKIISFALLLSVFIFPIQTFALDSEYIKKRGNTYKVDVVAIILECKKENKEDKKAFKKCFALKFLEVRKELKNEQKEAKKECDEEKLCIANFIKTRLTEKNITLEITEERSEEKLNTGKNTSQTKWRTSSHSRSKYYYCPKSDGWRGIIEKNLQEFDSAEELLKNYNRKLHPECE